MKTVEVTMVGMQRSVHDHKKELERMEVADTAVRERRAKMQMECYKAQFNPRVRKIPPPFTQKCKFGHFPSILFCEINKTLRYQFR